MLGGDIGARAAHRQRGAPDIAQAAEHPIELVQRRPFCQFILPSGISIDSSRIIRTDPELAEILTNPKGSKPKSAKDISMFSVARRVHMKTVKHTLGKFLDKNAEQAFSRPPGFHQERIQRIKLGQQKPEMELGLKRVTSMKARTKEERLAKYKFYGERLILHFTDVYVLSVLAPVASH